MSWKKIYAVIRREYIERVRTKAFWIGTLIIPFLFIGLICGRVRGPGGRGGAPPGVTGPTGPPPRPAGATPAAGERREKAGQRPGPGPRPPPRTGPPNRRPQNGTLGVEKCLRRATSKTKVALRREVLGKKIDAYMILDPKMLEKDHQVEYYSTTKSPEFVAMNQIERALNSHPAPRENRRLRRRRWTPCPTVRRRATPCASPAGSWPGVGMARRASRISPTEAVAFSSTSARTISATTSSRRSPCTTSAT